MQRVTPSIGNALGLVEKAMRETFVPDLFEGLGEGALERGVICLPVKQAGLDLPDPTMAAPENWMASCILTGHLVAALRVQVEFRTATTWPVSKRVGQRFGDGVNSGQRRHWR